MMAETTTVVLPDLDTAPSSLGVLMRTRPRPWPRPRSPPIPAGPIPRPWGGWIPGWRTWGCR